jgi:zinc protease
MTVLARAALVLVVLLAGCAGRSPAPAASTAGAGPVRESLPNGVVLIAHEHRASDVVALQLWVRVGGRDEAPAELGLSHYLEHMLFKGTPTRPPGSIDALVEGLGGTSNAFTSYDYTHYDVVLPAGHLRAGLELLADIAVNASFVPAELEAEKKVVYEEMNLLEDDPERFLGRRLAEIGYAGHPYGRPILGTRPLVESLTRERLAAYYRKHSVPATMDLVVVGPVPVAEARRVAAATVGRLEGPRPARPAVPPVPGTGPARSVDVRRPERQAYLGMAWATPPISGADVFAVDLLTYILGDGPSSRLNQAVRERDRLVAAIEAGYVTREIGGLVSVTARLDPANLDRAERSVLGVLAHVRDAGVTEEERQRALVTAESWYAFDIETAEGLAKSYGQAETTWTLGDELRYLERLRRVTPAEIQAAARKYLREDAYVRLRLVPEGAR